MRAAVFLDRDGTINEQMGYINHIDRFQMLPGAASAIRTLNDGKVPVVVVTNQSGLARGYFPLALLDAVHEKMKDALAREGAHVDGIYICPHHPEAKDKQYRLECTCRKPKTGLFEQAARELGIDLRKSYVVGDRWSDLKAAVSCRATPVLVLTGYGKGDFDYIGPHQKVQPVFVAQNLQDAVEWILDDMKGKTEE
ncbi:MAG: D-glycero-beta-D-manno-heptose 1,7-bisphosphate 7-phosphatase [Proteobacteria bacterium]|nr:D-glycero-beta-D-manno-heptose 1,7-bisphosphate 7-phosphatase [Pseudomonadota bacterium]MBU1639482.1 D-glycero-beta-D-manno-heptose 1,7-bisphosphate 7-phosphatase [Pseudomonadota bacterium]